MTTRRSFFGALLACLAVSMPIAADARGGRRGSGGRRSGGYGGSSSGGNSGGCGSRGGAGYRKANGKCAGRNE